MANTTIYKCKCMGCGLHYAIYTNFPEQWEGKNPFCPECGVQRTFTLAQEESEKFIFQFVPGSVTTGGV